MLYQNSFPIKCTAEEQQHKERSFPIRDFTHHRVIITLFARSPHCCSSMCWDSLSKAKYPSISEHMTTSELLLMAPQRKEETTRWQSHVGATDSDSSHRYSHHHHDISLCSTLLLLSPSKHYTWKPKVFKPEISCLETKESRALSRSSCNSYGQHFVAINYIPQFSSSSLGGRGLIEWGPN